MCLGTGRELVLLLYKGKGDFRVCGSYRRISLLSVVGKVCKDRAIWWWGGGQCGFRKWMGCSIQVFAVRDMSEDA